MRTIGIYGKIPEEVLQAAREVRRWVLTNNGGVSLGRCADASERLQKQLSNLGFEMDLVNGSMNIPNLPWGGSHTWLEHKDMILDTTADQFNHARVIVFRSIIWQPKSEVLDFYNTNWEQVLRERHEKQFWLPGATESYQAAVEAAHK